MADLSVLIPARQEMWLNKTIADVLEHARGDTEVIAVLDGAWPEVPIPDHPRLRLVHHSVPIGQRASVNLAARVSQARYVMKLDAHCSVAEGFDVELVRTGDELGPLVTQVPAQWNLHCFDWQCDGCGERIYQGPTPKACAKCGGQAHHREVIWKPRPRRRTVRWRFDQELHFQYWGEGEKRPDAKGELIETMSCLGACFVMARDRYWHLGGLDEAHGSWGQMGTEIGCKSWLSGGSLVTNTRTWFAHLFRTQGGDFGFPYEIHGSEQEAARQYSRDLWTQNRWPGQIHPLRWLVERFAPVPGWLDVPTPTAKAGILYYTDNRLDPTLAEACRRQLRRAAGDRPIACVSLAPLDFGDHRIVLNRERSYLTMFEQIMAGLEALTDCDLVFFAEHDMLYPAEHFTYVPGDRQRFYYNPHVWKVRSTDGHCLHYRCNQTSGLCAPRPLALEHYRKRLEIVRAHGYSRNMGFEPGTKAVRHGGVDDTTHSTWWTKTPLVDIRHEKNLTPSRWAKDQFRNQRNTAGWTEAEEVPGWGRPFGRFPAWLQEVTS